MAFIDEIRIRARAGNGGDGIVSWLHLKSKEFSGPAGGDGGKGGSVFMKATSDLGRLSAYQNIKDFVAENGGKGESRSRKGANGEDLYIEVPVGSLIKNITTGETFELLNAGESICVLKGGVGGYGNEHFKGSKNVTPQEHTLGTSGEDGEFVIELRLIADFGLVGLPNAGKSSLINSITNAKSKVGNYYFTTKEPHLGVLGNKIIADIPGLIEGAAENKGLGHAFLRHIMRTRVIVHCVSLESENPKEDYLTVRKELELYDPQMLDKTELLVLTKTDMVDADKIKKSTKEMSKLNKNIIAVSVLDDESMKKLKETLLTL